MSGEDMDDKDMRDKDVSGGDTSSARRRNAGGAGRDAERAAHGDQPVSRSRGHDDEPDGTAAAGRTDDGEGPRIEYREKTVPSTMAILQHPIHPMLINYPITFLSAAVVTDILFWTMRDAFWAELSFWLLAAGFGMGILAAVFGMLDFFTMTQVRRHVSAWNHFLTGITVIALAAANAAMRWEDPVAAVLPWGLVLSAALLVIVLVTGWLGGTLTFRHSIGAFSKDIDEVMPDGERPPLE